MGPWTYYSPLWLGALVSAGVDFTVLRRISEGPIWPFLIIIPIRSVAIGLGLQLMLIGVQGLFARVLPVPVGRSLRGGVAQVVGGLVLGHEAIGLLGLALYLLSDSLTLTFVFFAFSGACLVIALLIYLMNLPGAAQDF